MVFKKNSVHIFGEKIYKMACLEGSDVLSPTRKETSYSNQTQDLFNKLPTKLIFLSEWCEFPSVPCLAGKKHDSLCLDVVEIAPVT
jgi:hypothetical protein